jgi:hypothetical protein
LQSWQLNIVVPSVIKVSNDEGAVLFPTLAS